MTSSTTTRTLDPCLVCGDKSTGFNFGVLSCMACKAFFRRNAVKLGNYDFTCPKDGDCPITHTHRRLCNCCRLAKCFRLGMQKELILSEAAKVARREAAAQKRQKRVKTKKLEIVPVSRIQDIACTSLSYLSSSDQTLLRNIYNAYEFTCITAKSSKYQDFPLMKHTNLFTYLNEYSHTHKVLIDYVKIIPEFNKLCMNDRICLIRNQFGVINNINEAIVHPGVSDNLILSLTNIFGIHLADRLLECIERIQIFTYDPVILKLVLVIVSLSSGNYRNSNDTHLDQICDDPLSIFLAQNIYVELLWKYILSNSSSEINAVKFYNKLIQFLLYLLNVHLLVDGYINNLPSEIEKMEPLMQSMWPNPSNNDDISANEVF